MVLFLCWYMYTEATSGMWTSMSRNRRAKSSCGIYARYWMLNPIHAISWQWVSVACLQPSIICHKHAMRYYGRLHSIHPTDHKRQFAQNVFRVQLGKFTGSNISVMPCCWRITVNVPRLIGNVIVADRYRARRCPAKHYWLQSAKW